MQKVTQTSPYRHNARMRDRGLVGAVTGIAEERWRVGACDLGLAKDRGRVGAGDKRVNITAFSSGDRVGKFLEVTLPQS